MTVTFSVSPTFSQVSDRKVRVTGLSLGAGCTGSIGLFGSTASPDVTLPATFQPEPYTNSEGKVIPLQDSIQVSYVFDGAVTSSTPLSVVKSGTTNKTFLATLANGFETGSSPLEIY